MYYTLERLYNQGRITEAGLKKAVSFGWITEEQKVEIIASKKVA